MSTKSINGIYYIYNITIYIYIHITRSIAPRKAVAEVSKIGHYRRGELLL